MSGSEQSPRGPLGKSDHSSIHTGRPQAGALPGRKDNDRKKDRSQEKYGLMEIRLG